MARHIEVGRAGEARAATFYEERGARVLETNYRCPFGEIDLIVLDGEELAFVEVKTRSSDAFGGAQEAVPAYKKRRVERAAEAFLLETAVSYRGVRFDVVAITEGELMHIEDAWEAGCE